MVGLEPIVHVFRSCYQLVASTDDDNNMCQFFTFVNRRNNAMKNMLIGKPNYTKKWKGKWLVIRHTRVFNRQGGLQQIWGYSSYWKISPHEVNNKSCLILNKEKNCVVLDLTKINYKVNKMTKGNYQAILQGIKSSCHDLFLLVLESNILLSL